MKPRVVIVPKELQKFLDQNSQANALFEKLSYAHQKEYVNRIESARKEATRQRLLQKSFATLRENIKHP